MGFTFYIGELRVFFPYDSIYPEQPLGWTSVGSRQHYVGVVIGKLQRLMQLEQPNDTEAKQRNNTKIPNELKIQNTKFSKQTPIDGEPVFVLPQVSIHVRVEEVLRCEGQQRSRDAHRNRPPLLLRGTVRSAEVIAMGEKDQTPVG